MLILSVVLILGLPLGLLWVLSAIAWGRIRRPALSQDWLASGASPRFIYNIQYDDQEKETLPPVLAFVDEMIG
jgi:hypothetical protein